MLLFLSYYHCLCSLSLYPVSLTQLLPLSSSFPLSPYPSLFFSLYSVLLLSLLLTIFISLSYNPVRFVSLAICFSLSSFFCSLFFFSFYKLINFSLLSPPLLFFLPISFSCTFSCPFHLLIPFIIATYTIIFFFHNKPTLSRARLPNAILLSESQFFLMM